MSRTAKAAAQVAALNAAEAGKVFQEVAGGAKTDRPSPQNKFPDNL